MKKKCLCIIFCFLLFICAPILQASSHESTSERLNQFVIGLFTPDLFEADEVFDAAIVWLRETYPNLEIKFKCFSPESITAQKLHQVDVLFFIEAFQRTTSETAYLSHLGDLTKELVNFWETPLNIVIQKDLYPFSYLTSDTQKPLLFCPISINPTVLIMDQKMDDFVQKANLSVAQLENPVDWGQFAKYAEKFSQVKMAETVFLLEDQFSDLPTIAHQISAYLHIQASANRPIDKAAIISNLQAFKQLYDIIQIDLVDSISGIRNNVGLLMSAIALYQSGENYYTVIPPFSIEMEICPASGILGAVPRYAENGQIAIEFIGAMLSKRCHSAYNVMGVIRKDIDHEPMEGYECFLAPEHNNEDVYRRSMQYAAFPYLNSEDAQSYQKVLKDYLCGETSAEIACHKLIEITLKSKGCD